MTATALEQAILGSVQRGMRDLADFAQGALKRAAADLLATSNPHVVLLTGFAVPAGDGYQPETDGPVGTVQVAYALQRLGIPARILTDSMSARALEVGMAAVNLKLPLEVAPATDPIAYSAWQTATLAGYAVVTHMIAIERPGPALDGRVYTMGGRDITAVTAPLHQVFHGRDWRTIAIGDGGNELGMGNLHRDAVKRFVDRGDVIHCVIPADHLILCGTSNWGATGLVIELAQQSRSISMTEALQPRLSYRVIDALHRQRAAVDGVTGEPLRSVDGIDWPRYCLQLETILPRFL